MTSALGNEVLADTYDSLRSRQQRVTIGAVKANLTRLPTIHTEHAELVTALKRCNGDRAAAILHAHLRPVSDVITHLPGYRQYRRSAGRGRR